MPENIFTPFQVKLFGRVMTDLKIVPPGGTADVTADRQEGFAKATDFDDSSFEQQIKGRHDPAIVVSGASGYLKPERERKSTPTLARIYGFAYEGHYYAMPKPTIFLVDGLGFPPGADTNLVSAFKNISGAIRTTIDQSGTGARDWYFEDDVKMWVYDKSSHSIRFDLTAGKFEDILLEATLSTMARMASREGDLASREGDLASREGDLASREGDMAARSGDMAFRARYRFR